MMQCQAVMPPSEFIRGTRLSNASPKADYLFHLPGWKRDANSVLAKEEAMKYGHKRRPARTQKIFIRFKESFTIYDAATTRESCTGPLEGGIRLYGSRADVADGLHKLHI
jgi:hypothetical protein